MRALLLLSLWFAATNAARADEPASPDAAMLAAKEVELKRLQAEVAELRTKLNVGEPQIAVRVRMVEVPEGTMERLRAEAEREASNKLPEKSEAKPTQQTPAAMLAADDPFMARLESWLKKPDSPVKSLMDSTVVTQSKRPAYVNSGGEFPVVVPQSFGKGKVEYRRFGMQIDAVPELLDDGRIKLKVRPRSSERDPSRSVTINGNEVPSLRVFEFDLSVEMTPGQVLAVRGVPQLRAPPKPKPGEPAAPAQAVELVTLISTEIVSPGTTVEIIKTSAELPLGTTPGELPSPAATRPVSPAAKPIGSQAAPPTNRRPGLLPRRGRS